MDNKIYTRKRIKLPSIRFMRFSNRKKTLKQKLTFELVIILIIAIITLTSIIKSISPIIDRVCEDAARAKATIVSNDMSTEVMKDYVYDDLVSIYKDSKGNITMIQSNIIKINEITSSVATKIQDKLINSDESIVTVKFRKL